MNANNDAEMNIQEKDILCHLMEHPFENQRGLADSVGYSLGIVNRSLKNLVQTGYLTEHMELTAKAKKLMQTAVPERAVILAAGTGIRMVPISTEVTKGLLEVRGEVLIERLIRQLQEAGIREIYVVVGFLKEQYEYLMDEFSVQLIVNKDYASLNNLYSLKLADRYLDNTYVIPCDIWCESNPFHRYELYSWYMVCDEEDRHSDVRMNRKYELVRSGKNKSGNRMVGIAYLQKEASRYVKKQMEQMTADGIHEDSFWEDALWQKDTMITAARCIPATKVFEINTYEQLRQMDSKSGSLNSDVLSLIADVLSVKMEDITDITVLKKGMTNRSFRFACKGKRYIMRIPGVGTEQLINRREEYEVYQVIRDKKICDDIYYINPDNGYKMTEFLENARVCDAENQKDVARCMSYLRKFHESGLKVGHSFDIFGHIEYYESLWNGESSVYRDYAETKKKMYELREYIDSQQHEWTLTHIDAIPDNFMFLENGDIRLIDWEYAGMQDPHVDIAMFAIYALYDRSQVEELMQAYFPEGVPDDVRLKIYCYIAVCGLLWSNWCEYKRLRGVEFGEYSLRQYRYAKDYYRIFKEEKERLGNHNI